MVSDQENYSWFRHYCRSVCRLAGVDCHGSALPRHSGGMNQIHFSFHCKLNTSVKQFNRVIQNGTFSFALHFLRKVLSQELSLF